MTDVDSMQLLERRTPGGMEARDWGANVSEQDEKWSGQKEELPATTRVPWPHAVPIARRCAIFVYDRHYHQL